MTLYLRGEGRLLQLQEALRSTTMTVLLDYTLLSLFLHAPQTFRLVPIIIAHYSHQHKPQVTSGGDK